MRIETGENCYIDESKLSDGSRVYAVIIPHDNGNWPKLECIDLNHAGKVFETIEGCNLI